jgi:predicted nucleic acid-binding protein
VIFVDTSFLVALLLPKDANHPRAVGAVNELGPVRLSDLLVTTNNVVLETITVARYEASHKVAVRAGELLYRQTLARIHRTTADDEAAALAYLKKYKDKEYSAVDCLSFVVMEQLGIREAFAFDSDFEHRFIARPGPR